VLVLRPLRRFFTTTLTRTHSLVPTVTFSSPGSRELRGSVLSVAPPKEIIISIPTARSIVTAGFTAAPVGSRLILVLNARDVPLSVPLPPAAAGNARDVPLSVPLPPAAAGRQGRWLPSTSVVASCLFQHTQRPFTFCFSTALLTAFLTAFVMLTYCCIYSSLTHLFLTAFLLFLLLHLLLFLVS
jgi:hypothetical protein